MQTSYPLREKDKLFFPCKRKDCCLFGSADKRNAVFFFWKMEIENFENRERLLTGEVYPFAEPWYGSQ